MSTGETVDCVLMYTLPEDEKDRLKVLEHAHEPESSKDSEEVGSYLAQDSRH